MARAKQPRLHAFISRTDFQYIAAFTLGCLAPLLGGVVAGAVSSALWSLTVDATNYAGTHLNLVNSATLATGCLVYLGGMVLLFGAYRRFGVRPSNQSLLTAMIAAAAVAALAIAVSIQSYAYSPNLSVYLDIVSIALFGLGYVVGWWVVKRYAKLGR